MYAIRLIICDLRAREFVHTTGMLYENVAFRFAGAGEKVSINVGRGARPRPNNAVTLTATHVSSCQVALADVHH